MTGEELAGKIKDEIGEDERLHAILDRIREGKATFTDSELYAAITARITAQQMRRNVLSLDKREAAFVDITRERYTDTFTVFSAVQRILDAQNGIRIRPQEPGFDTGRASKIGHSLEDQTVPDSTIERRARSATENFCMSHHDDCMRTNAEFRARAGLQSYAIRDGSAKCCDWCADVSGKYPANETPQGFWGRHDNCKCSILYESKRGGRQLLRGTSKKWEQVAPGAGELHRMTAEQVAAVGAGAVHWLTPGEVVNNPLRILTNDAERATMNLLDNIELFIGADAITDEQKKTFEEALAPVPNNLLQQLAEYVSGIRIVEDRGYSSYNRETREIILDRATGSDSIIHELGHAFGDMLGLYNDPEFLEILSSGLNNENWYDVYRMPHPHTGEDVWVLPADKFITPYQGRIYADITDVDWSAPIDLRAFREYISISFKAFFDNKDLLKTKDPRLYQYLEGKIYD